MVIVIYHQEEEQKNILDRHWQNMARHLSIKLYALSCVAALQTLIKKYEDFTWVRLTHNGDVVMLDEFDHPDEPVVYYAGPDNLLTPEIPGSISVCIPTDQHGPLHASTAMAFALWDRRIRYKT
jgi:hypothetical protein